MMHTEDSLKELWENYPSYFWIKDNLTQHQIRLGSTDEATLILRYNTATETTTIERTVFRELKEKVTLPILTFSNDMTEHRIIKDLIDLMSGKLTTDEFKQRNIVSYDSLVFFSTKFINDNFDFEY